ncbi:MAG: LysM peptidoglycan-binding domain-containing protein [Anaerolineales bacterium]|nr:LysM peptidoglycan-binding domain-containing protein [Anaerolineales bacterium]MCA9930723.1 LysM peptidoglycan-binding domain-containing protein [Anaerolineales bacterium]
MNDELAGMNADEANAVTERRCPSCDAVVPEGDTVCIMCGAVLPATAAPETAVSIPPTPLPTKPEPAPVEKDIAVETAVSPPEIVEFVMREKQSPIVFGMTSIFFIFIFVLGALILKFQGPVAAVQFIPTVTPTSPPPTLTPTATPLPTETTPPTAVPSITPTPAPTETLQPPRIHVVTSGETLIGLSLIYRVSPQSIGELNGFTADTQVQVNQNLQIPWPTPTPPLEVVPIVVNGETVLLDPTDCERYEIQEGDSLVGIAALYGINFDQLAVVNRINDPALVQPGDTICIPELVYGSSSLLPATPGPSPTPSPIPPPPGPILLYPANNTVIEPPTDPITLQWIAVKDLEPDELYMVEVNNIDELDGLPFRGFTRDTAFHVPGSWRPTTPETQQLRWRVSIVKTTGERSDGVPIYTFGGNSSEDAYFFWPGAIPTPTPSPTYTPAPTMTPSS